MTSSFSRARWATIALAAALSVGSIAAPHASAAPTDPADRFWKSQPAPAVPQQPGYQITGYNIGKGNYRGAIDAQTGSLWLTNVSPFDGASESSILKVDPNTMEVRKRIRITKRIKNTGHGTIAGQYEVNVPKTGNTVWTTAAAANEVSVWDKNSGKLLKTFPVKKPHGVVFAEQMGVAIVSGTKPGGLKFYDMNTLTPIGSAVMPGKGTQMGANIALTDVSATGATVTLPSYYSSLTQFRITRSGGGAVKSTVRWNATLSTQGHGFIVADTRTNRVYVNDLYQGIVTVHDLRTGRHIRDVFTGPGTTSLMLFQGKVYAANYFGGFISVIDQNTFGVSRLVTTGLLPNQLLYWKKNTFLVIDKSSMILDGGYRGNRGTDHIWKVRRLG
ncbi:hypothetical protein GOARA_088_00180 [Gordonia araii NBRC 100433]|uniref:SMP-30/Gluconolactonase/LRE-like region domain-containing protein n=1 Tax=Gordonia araii NBRC 100433 TaxID=1073574 RepID=G7H7D0_9ACTN|nr:hypothetical protein [Gordonia araii]NNG98438.1 hypothetical protein [Gordonia araii NBRC 100433]GAB11755.1 hypothetical protein GOARA_088_00180 [Gordonia araii NBRC 100433]